MNTPRRRLGMTHVIDHRPFRFGAVALGDALDDAKRAARDNVDAVAGSYTLPNAATTREQAIMAYRLLMRSARAEVPKLALTYGTLSNDAAWFYRAATVETVLRAAINVLSDAPRTRSIAQEVLNVSRAAQVAAVKKAKAAASNAYPKAPQVVIDSAPLPLMERLRPYAGPIIGGAAALLGLAVYFWSSKRSPA